MLDAKVLEIMPGKKARYWQCHSVSNKHPCTHETSSEYARTNALMCMLTHICLFAYLI